MLKRLALAMALFASSAWAQQELALTAKDIESGAADAKLAELGRQAAVTGREVVVNAPKEWHAKIAAKVKAGGKADVKLNDSFFENVVVRVSDKAAPKPAEPVEPPKPAVATKPAAAPKPVETPKPAAPVAAPKPVEPPPAPAPKPVETPPPAPVEPAPAPVAPPPAPVEAPKPAAPAPAVASPADPSVAVRQRLLQSLNEGRPAAGDLDVSQLQKGDTVYIEGSVRAVVRRDRLKTALHWLAGELNPKRAELRPLGENRYEVLEPLSAGEVSLRNDPTGAPQLFTGKIPGDGDAERLDLEKAYGEGRTITRSARADQLKQGDILYLGKSAGVVVRRDGTTLVRYWLDGGIDLNQRGLQKDKDSASKYRVLSDNIR